MGMAAAWKARRILGNAQRVVAAELLCAAQGLEFLKPLAPGRGVGELYRRLRGLPPRCRPSRRTGRRPPTWSGWPAPWPTASSIRGPDEARWRVLARGSAGRYLSLTPSLVSASPSQPEPHESGKAEGLGAEVRAEGGLAEGDRGLPQGHPADRVRGRDEPGSLPLQPRRRPLPQDQRHGRRGALLRARGRPVRRPGVLQQRHRALRQDPPGQSRPHPDLSQAGPAARPQERRHRGQAEPASSSSSG